MDETKFEEMLTADLKALKSFNPLHIEYLAWFADDFSQFAQTFANAVISQITSVQFVGTETESAEARRFNYFILIDYLLQNCQRCIQYQLELRLPDAIQSFITTCSPMGVLQMNQLVANWKAKECLQDCLQDIERVLKEAPLQRYQEAPQTKKKVEPKQRVYEGDVHYSRAWMRSATDWEKPNHTELIVPSDL